MSAVRASRALNASPSITGTLSMKQAGKLRSSERPRCLLVTDVPSTALPTDLLRALKDGGAVQRDFALTSITSPPPSLPRQPSLSKTYHLTFPSAALAFDAHRLLSHAPLFPSTSTLRSRATALTPPPARVQFTTDSADQWTAAQLEGAISALSGSYPAGATRFEAAWASREGVQGRRVVVKGLPGKVSPQELAKLFKDCKVERVKDAIKRLPPSPTSTTSVWAVTTESVSAAYALARKVHMNWYFSTLYGETYLMRARVHW
ncbi:hypothetical protein Q5752_003928 [Cryptotrichosporon argae]